MDNNERQEFADELLVRMRADGAPARTWLLDIEQTRRGLAQAADRLRRMQDAIVREAMAQEVRDHD